MKAKCEISKRKQTKRHFIHLKMSYNKNKEGNTYYYKSILPSGPLKTKIFNKNYNN